MCLFIKRPIIVRDREDKKTSPSSISSPWLKPAALNGNAYSSSEVRNNLAGSSGSLLSDFERRENDCSCRCRGMLLRLATIERYLRHSPVPYRGDGNFSQGTVLEVCFLLSGLHQARREVCPVPHSTGIPSCSKGETRLIIIHRSPTAELKRSKRARR
jgi:hypothetical protein